MLPSVESIFTYDIVGSGHISFIELYLISYVDTYIQSY